MLSGNIYRFIATVFCVFFCIFPFFIFNSFLYQGSSSRFLLLSLTVALCGFVLGVYLLNNKNRISLLKSPLLIALGVYGAYLFVSSLLGADFSASFWSRAERTSGLFYLLHLGMFVFFLVHLFKHEHTREKILDIVIITSAIYSLASFLGPQGFDLIFTNNPYDGFMFGNSSFAAMYLFGAFLLSLYKIFKTKEVRLSWYRYVLPVVIILNPFFVNRKLFLGSVNDIGDVLGVAQASSISLLVSLGILFVIFLISKIKKENLKRAAVWALVGTAFVLLAWGMTSLLRAEGLLRSAYEQVSTKARPLVWEISGEAIKERPVTGWGIDNFYAAYQEHFDNRLLTAEYGNEPWFDRAHNIVIDQTVESGYVGVIGYFSLYLLAIILLVRVALRTNERRYAVLASLLAVYLFCHLLELQTAFDTTISYPMLALMFALAVVVVHETKKDTSYYVPGNILQTVLGIGTLALFSWTLIFGIIPFWNVQAMNGTLRTVGGAEKRIPLYETIFNTKVDPAGILWRTATDFQQGIAQNPQVLEKPESVAKLTEELGVITKGYEAYVADHPDSFRPYLNLADLYIYHMLFGVNRLDEAEVAVDKALLLSDRHPQPYWMKAIISLYRRDFKKAREYVTSAKEINENAVETKRLEKYIEESIKTFPEIDLYYFNQI